MTLPSSASVTSSTTLTTVTVATLSLLALACSKASDVRCGDGTTLRDGVCVIAEPPRPTIAPLPAVTAAPVPVVTPAAAPVVTPAAPPPPPAPPPVPSRWAYRSSDDKMRGAVSDFAINDSLNEVNIGSPYGVVSLRMTLRKGAKFGNDVILGLSEGQLQCGIMSGCAITVKFDDAKVRRFTADESSSPMNSIIFLRDVAGFVAKLKTAKHAIIEVDTFTSGSEQFEFDVAGLDWTLYKGPVLKE